jgi:hypothetical protein
VAARDARVGSTDAEDRDDDDAIHRTHGSVGGDDVPVDTAQPAEGGGSQGSHDEEAEGRDPEDRGQEGRGHPEAEDGCEEGGNHARADHREEVIRRSEAHHVAEVPEASRRGEEGGRDAQADDDEAQGHDVAHHAEGGSSQGSHDEEAQGSHPEDRRQEGRGDPEAEDHGRQEGRDHAQADHRSDADHRAEVDRRSEAHDHAEVSEARGRRQEGGGDTEAADGPGAKGVEPVASDHGIARAPITTEPRSSA